MNKAEHNICKKLKHILVCFAIAISGFTYSQFTYTFTNANITGRFGPTQAQINLAYAATNLNGLVNVATQGIQSWTVPISGPYRIEAFGAKGGNHFNGTFGGNGAKIQGDFIFTAGTVLNIIVGQQGQIGSGNSVSGGGGGGASFVWINNQTITPLIAAGGGGGGYLLPGGQGTISTNGSNGTNGGGLGGTTGNPGADGGGCAGAGGGGWNNGNPPPIYSCIGQETQPVHGQGLANLFIGGGMGHTYGSAGGFGGGAGSVQGGGGAGGYSGGGGSSQNVLSVSGGGGSYNAGTNQTNTSGFNSSNGKVIISLLYSAYISQTNPISCYGFSNAALSSTIYSGAAPISYTWLPSGANSATISGLSSGIYTLIAKDANNLITTANYTITQPSVLSSSILTQNNANCFGANTGSASISSSGATAPYSYTWSPSGGNLSSATGLIAGTYTVLVKDANNCSALNTLTITEPNSFLNITANNTLVCLGNSVIINVSGANTYTLSGGITSGIAFSPSITTNYTVTGTNTLIGCSITAIKTISVSPLPNLSASATPSVICYGNSIVLNGAGATTYTWTGGFPSGFPFYPPTTTIFTLTGTSTLTGCSKKVFQTVVVNPIPIITLNNGSICNGQSYTLTPNGALSYTYSSGSDVITPTVTSVYSVTGTSSLGCISGAAALVTITVNPLPVLNFIGNFSVCSGVSASITVNGANTYTWSTGVNSSSVILTPSITSVYSVSGKSSFGCTNTNTVAIYLINCSSIQNNIFSETEIKFFPNPTNGLLNLEITQFQSSIICVLNSLGQVIYFQNSENINLIDLRNFENGIYFIQVNKNNKPIYRSKIIKQ